MELGGFKDSPKGYIFRFDYEEVNENSPLELHQFL